MRDRFLFTKWLTVGAIATAAISAYATEALAAGKSISGYLLSSGSNCHFPGNGNVYAAHAWGDGGTCQSMHATTIGATAFTQYPSQTCTTNHVELDVYDANFNWISTLCADHSASWGTQVTCPWTDSNGCTWTAYGKGYNW